MSTTVPRQQQVLFSGVRVVGLLVVVVIAIVVVVVVPYCTVGKNCKRNNNNNNNNNNDTFSSTSEEINQDGSPMESTPIPEGERSSSSSSSSNPSSNQHAAPSSFDPTTRYPSLFLSTISPTSSSQPTTVEPITTMKTSSNSPTWLPSMTSSSESSSPETTPPFTSNPTGGNTSSIHPTVYPSFIPSTFEPSLFPSTIIPTTEKTADSPTTTRPSTIAPTTEIPTSEPSTAPTTTLPSTTSPTTVAPTKTTPTLIESPSLLQLDEIQGAIVTYDCMFLDYPYAIDILLSCGDERFNDALRLHTYKRHSYDHHLVFSDQLITVRNNGELWFEEYQTPRCVWIDPNTGRLRLTATVGGCTTFQFAVVVTDQQQDRFLLQVPSPPLEADDNIAATRCVGLGDDDDSTTTCNSDRSTGGRECGGIDHRFLPLQLLQSCGRGALIFTFEMEASTCNGEFPEDACFDGR